jgi:hypothetical protein
MAGKNSTASVSRFLQQKAATSPASVLFGEDNIVIIDEDEKEVVCQETLELPGPAGGSSRRGDTDDHTLRRSEFPAAATTAPPDANFKFGGDLRRRRQQEEEQNKEFEAVKKEEIRKKEQQRLKKIRKEVKMSSREAVPIGSEEYWDKEDKESERGKKGL